MSSAVDAIKDVFGSVFGSAVCVYTGQPFDTIKVRLQVAPAENFNTIRCIQRTVQYEGIRALWKGSVPAFIGAVSENATAFALNGQFNRILGSDSDWCSEIMRPFALGSMAGFCTAFVLCPPDIVKCRHQVLRLCGTDANTYNIVMDVYRNQGLRGFYTGISLQVMRDIPFFAFFFGTYEYLCHSLARNSFLSGSDPWCESARYLVSGGVAGQIAWVTSLPFDTVKSVVQTQGCSLGPHYLTPTTGSSTTSEFVGNATSISTASTPSRLKSSLEITREIFRQYGIKGFFRGVEITVLRAFPANAALFWGYEVSKKMMEMW